MGNATFQKRNAGFPNWNRGFQNRNHVFSNVPTWNRVTPAHIHIFRNWSGGMQKRNVHPGNGIVDCKTNSCCVQTMGRVSHENCVSNRECGFPKGTCGILKAKWWTSKNGIVDFKTGSGYFKMSQMQNREYQNWNGDYQTLNCKYQTPICSSFKCNF